MTFKNTEGHYNCCYIRLAVYRYYFLLLACCYNISKSKSSQSQIY